jgi:TM2 domain-containing membrane protein YozV
MFTDNQIKYERLRKNGLLAAALSFLIPGLGQLYTRETGAAIIIFIAAMAGYVCCIIPGLLMHLIAIIGAYNGANVYNANLMEKINKNEI